MWFIDRTASSKWKLLLFLPVWPGKTESPGMIIDKSATSLHLPPSPLVIAKVFAPTFFATSKAFMIFIELLWWVLYDYREEKNYNHFCKVTWSQSTTTNSENSVYLLVWLSLYYALVTIIMFLLQGLLLNYENSFCRVLVRPRPTSIQFVI